MNPSTERSGAEFNSSQAERAALPDVDLNLLKNTEVDISFSLSPEQSVLNPEALTLSNQAKIVGQSSDNSANVQMAMQDLNTSKTSTVSVKDGDKNASDGGRIEQIWVDEAKKIINSTSENPRLREERIKKLRDEYLLEKYGFRFEEPKR